MTRRRSGGDANVPGSFAELARETRPLADRRKLRPPPQGPAVSAPRAAAAAPRHFVVEASAQGASGRAADVSRAVLAKLAAGDFGPDREVDLHGLRARAARERLVRELESAHRAGARCVGVIHGRGLHSESGAVLREALPGWLQQPPLAELTLAFARAPRALGGPGATLVLLRRARGPAVSSAARTAK
jgi:DNA-nicking Smr family endonuclease